MFILSVSAIIFGCLVFTEAEPQVAFSPTIVPYRHGFYYIPYQPFQNPAFPQQRQNPIVTYLYSQPIQLLPVLALPQNHFPQAHFDDGRKKFNSQPSTFHNLDSYPRPVSVSGIPADDYRIDYVIAAPEISGFKGTNIPNRAEEPKQVIGFVPLETKRGSTSDDRNPLRSIIAAYQPPPSSTKQIPKCGLRVKNIKDKMEYQEEDVESENEELNIARTALNNSPLQSLEWGGPDLSKTIFSEKGGINTFLMSKITFGEVAARYEAPWQVAIFAYGKFHCGASIIGEKHLMTAAHCVVPFVRKPTLMKIVLGDWDLRSKQDGTGVEVEADTVFAHADFSFYSLRSDIAVIKLKNKIVFSDNIQPVCLPTSEVTPDELVTVTGWGRNENSRLQTKLQKIEAAVVSHETCSVQWIGKGVSPGIIGPKTLCVNTQYGDSCKGDSGGPAWKEYPAASGSFYQVGIVSFGSGSCTDVNLPGVYTRVAAFLTWIEEKMAL